MRRRLITFYLGYTRDALNDPVQVQENGATSGVGLLASYGYDALGRRTSLTRAGGSGSSTAWGYDTSSRLSTLSQTLTGSSSVAYTFGYNAANQIVSRAATNDGYTAHPGALNYGYATNGLNQYSGVTGATQAYDPTMGAALTYDPLGRPQSSTANDATSTFLYDGSDLIAEYNASGAIVGRYADNPGADEPLVWYQGGGTSTRSWLGADNQGSVIVASDSAGNAQGSYTYGPYGEPITATGAPAWGGPRYRYTGQVELPEARLYHYKARAYDPSTGRFLQTDPIGLGSDVNLYAYATNDPVNGTDTSGLVDISMVPKINIPTGPTDPPIVYSDCGNGFGCGVTSGGQPAYQSPLISGNRQTLFPASTTGGIPLYDLAGNPIGGNESGGGSRGGRGGAAPTPNLMQCTARFADKHSVASALSTGPGMKTGVGGFIADALGGNAFTGLGHLGVSIVTGSSGGHTRAYNSEQALVAGPTLGFGPALDTVAPGLSEAYPGLIDVAEVAVVGAGYASGIAEAKLAYDATAVGVGGMVCLAGGGR